MGLHPSNEMLIEGPFFISFVCSSFHFVLLTLSYSSFLLLPIEAGNEALQLLLNPKTALVAAIEKLEVQLDQLESGRLDEALLRNLDQSTQVLSKLVGIEGLFRVFVPLPFRSQQPTIACSCRMPCLTPSSPPLSDTHAPPTRNHSDRRRRGGRPGGHHRPGERGH